MWSGADTKNRQRVRFVDGFTIRSLPPMVTRWGGQFLASTSVLLKAVLQISACATTGCSPFQHNLCHTQTSCFLQHLPPPRRVMSGSLAKTDTPCDRSDKVNFFVPRVTLRDASRAFPYGPELERSADLTEKAETKRKKFNHPNPE